ncbi:MAG: hypothetical protein JO273_09005 [Methylobacteriaceae bacterium]|nr:hypothetical protein [Methylobacteriaceae bacterium]
MKAAVIGSLIVAASLWTLAPSPAQAWYCQASSNTGAWGWGTNYWLGAARQRALLECAVRTPRWGRCFITSCS